MTYKQVYVDLENLTSHQEKILKEITGLEYFEKFLHYYEDLNEWISFGVFTDDFDKELVTVQELFKLIDKEESYLSVYEPPLSINGDENSYEISQPKSDLLNELLDIALLYLAVSFIANELNIFEWHKSLIGVLMILIILTNKIKNR